MTFGKLLVTYLRIQLHFILGQENILLLKSCACLHIDDVDRIRAPSNFRRLLTHRRPCDDSSNSLSYFQPPWKHFPFRSTYQLRSYFTSLSHPPDMLLLLLSKRFHVGLRRFAVHAVVSRKLHLKQKILHLLYLTTHATHCPLNLFIPVK